VSGRRRRPKATPVAARCYVRSSFTIDCSVVSYGRSVLPGYAWIFPLGENEYNVGYYIRPEWISGAIPRFLHKNGQMETQNH